MTRKVDEIWIILARGTGTFKVKASDVEDKLISDWEFLDKNEEQKYRRWLKKKKNGRFQKEIELDNYIEILTTRQMLRELEKRMIFTKSNEFIKVYQKTGAIHEFRIDKDDILEIFNEEKQKWNKESYIQTNENQWEFVEKIIYDERDQEQRAIISKIRKKHGMETDSGSYYHALRSQGLSDYEAAVRDLQGRFLLPHGDFKEY